MSIIDVKALFVKHMRYFGSTLDNFPYSEDLISLLEESPDALKEFYPGGLSEIRQISKDLECQFWSNIFSLVFSNEKLSNPPAVINLAASYVKGAHDDALKLIDRQIVYVPSRPGLEDGDGVFPEPKS